MPDATPDQITAFGAQADSRRVGCGDRCVWVERSPQGGYGRPARDFLCTHGQAARAPLEDAAALEQQLLTRLIALNHARTAEEKRGLIRWLRPDYQNPVGRGGLAAPTIFRHRTAHPSSQTEALVPPCG